MKWGHNDLGANSKNAFQVNAHSRSHSVGIREGSAPESGPQQQSLPQLWLAFLAPSGDQRLLPLRHVAENPTRGYSLATALALMSLPKVKRPAGTGQCLRF